MFEISFMNKQQKLIYDQTTHILKSRHRVYGRQIGMYPGRMKFNNQIRIIATHACNANCIYCHKSKDSFVEPLSTYELVEGIVQKYKKIRSVCIYGGEPLLEFNFIKELRDIFEFQPNKLPHIWFSTNGILFEDPYIRNWLLNSQVTPVFSHDAYEQKQNRGYEILDNPHIVDFIRKILQTKKSSFTAMVTTNMYRYLDILNFLKEVLQYNDIYLGGYVPLFVTHDSTDKIALRKDQLMDYIRINYSDFFSTGIYKNLVRIQELTHAFIATLSKPVSILQNCTYANSTCMLGKNIDRAGNILGCYNYTDKDYQVDNTGKNMYSNLLGNIKDNLPIYKINRSKEVLRIQEEYHNQIKDKCDKCLVRNLCQGYCKAYPARFYQRNCEIRFAYYTLVMLTSITDTFKDMIKNIKDLETDQYVFQF